MFWLCHYLIVLMACVMPSFTATTNVLPYLRDLPTIADMTSANAHSASGAEFDEAKHDATTDPASLGLSSLRLPEYPGTKTGPAEVSNTSTTRRAALDQERFRQYLEDDEAFPTALFRPRWVAKVGFAHWTHNRSHTSTPVPVAVSVYNV